MVAEGDVLGEMSVIDDTMRDKMEAKRCLRRETEHARSPCRPGTACCRRVSCLASIAARRAADLLSFHSDRSGTARR